MASDFTKLVDDLAYAKTYYPTSKVTQYINSLAAKIYLGIYRNRKEESNRLWRFWSYDVPYTVGKHYRTILFSFIVFCVFFAVGFFSSETDPVFVREILGSQRIDILSYPARWIEGFGITQIIYQLCKITGHFIWVLRCVVFESLPPVLVFFNEQSFSQCGYFEGCKILIKPLKENRKIMDLG